MRKIYRINEFAKRIGKAPSTIRRWEREGKLIATNAIRPDIATSTKRMYAD